MKNIRDSISAGRVAWCIVLLTLVFTAIIRYRLLGVPLERDEGEYAYAAQLILQGIPPYQELYAMKLPGIYAAYALLLSVFGQTHQGIHAGLLVINAITVVFVFLLARRIISPVGAAVSAAAFAVFSTDQTMTGAFANAEHFVNLFTASGLFILMCGLENGSLLRIFLAGVLLGAGSTMKQHALFFVAFALIYVVILSLTRSPAKKRQVFLQLSAVVAGLAVVFSALLLTLYWAGVFKSFGFWTVDYARAYVSQISVQKATTNFLGNAAPVVRSAPLLWALVGIGILALLKKGTPKQYKIFLIGYAIFSFLSICPGFYFRPHYFLLLLPCAGILVGNGVNGVTTSVSGFSSKKIQYAIPTILVVIALTHTIYLQRNYLFYMSTFQITRATYGINPFYESIELADYIKSHTKFDDYIAILGSEPQIYFYAHRRSASGHIYMYPMMENHEFAKAMQQAFIADIEKKDPRYILFVNVPFSWLRRSDSHQRLFEWFKDDYRIRKLEMVGVAELFDDKAVYHWQPHVKWPVDSRYWVAVFERTR